MQRNFKQELLIEMCRVHQISKKVPDTAKTIGIYLYRYRAKPLKRYGPCPLAVRLRSYFRNTIVMYCINMNGRKRKEISERQC
jgi:hypothetical protein